MPLYEYLCGSCGHRFERIQKFSDAPIDRCPSCGAAEVEKLISSPAIQFKGTGWYVTDYAKSGKPAPSSTPGGDKSSTDSGSGDSTAKPAASETPSSGRTPTTATPAKS